MNDTIRNNILFGQPWHGERYRWVLGACALGADLSLLSHGDQTLVGELGTRLSGGCQRQHNLDAQFMWGFATVGTKVVVT